jgi:hypothetical protein
MTNLKLYGFYNNTLEKKEQLFVWSLLDTVHISFFSKFFIQLYAWPLLETVFSEVLTRDEWLTLWDHVVSNPPSFLLLLTVAYSICARGPLMQCTELDDFQVTREHINSFRSCSEPHSL